MLLCGIDGFRFISSAVAACITSEKRATLSKWADPDSYIVFSSFCVCVSDPLSSLVFDT